MWAEPDASLFSVRGPNYLIDKKKVPSKKSRFRLVGVDLFAFENEKERYNLASRPGSHVQSAQGFTFVINMIIPSPTNMSMVRFSIISFSSYHPRPGILLPARHA